MFSQSLKQREKKAAPTSVVRDNTATSPPDASEHPILDLQRSIGNQAVTRMLEGNQKDQPVIQTKLAISEPGDVYEQEADRVADQVLTAPAQSNVTSTPPNIQRASGPANAQMETASANVDQSIAGPGQPLEPAIRQEMEQHFGHDFSSVRVHSDSGAERSAQELNANAYTVGNNIVFNAGQFAPATSDGKKLLAHELTHVVQQAPGLVSRQIKAEDKTPSTQPGVKKPLTLPERAEQVWQSLGAWARRAIPEFLQARTRIIGYIERYDAAYKTFADKLKEAEEEAEAKDKWSDVLQGIVIGTGIGFAAGKLYQAASLVKKIADKVPVVYEAAGEVAEAGVAAVVQSAPGSAFTPPADLTADHVARGFYEQMDKAFLAQSLMLLAQNTFSPLRDKLTKSGSAQSPTAPQVERELESLKAALDSVDQALTDFVTTTETPLLDRSEEQIRQDIWIRWAASRGESDEDLVEELLREAGVVGYQGSLGYRIQARNIGFWSTRFHPGTVRQQVAAEKESLAQIGRLAVVISPSQRFAHFRHDAYAAIGREDPDPQSAEEYFYFSYEGAALQRGDIVILAGAGYAQKLKGANAQKRLPVTDDERARDPYEWQELQREREEMVFGPDAARGPGFSDRW